MAEAIRVLYVDDEPALLELSRKFLQKNGNFQVDLLTSAGAALEHLQTNSYDAIVSDYQMPEMDGITFLKKLKASGNTTPFIFFTGKGREEVVIEALNEGADFYLQKGGEPKSQFAELSNKIRYAVTRRCAEEALYESQKYTAEIIEFFPDATFAIDQGGKVIAWNRAIEQMTGIHKDDMIGKGDHEVTIPFYGERRQHLLDLIDFDDEKIKAKYLYVKRTGTTLYAEVFTPALYGGKGAYVWATGSPLFDVHGNRIGAIESIRDITELKRTEADLRESEERYRHVVEDQTEFICRFLPNGTHIFVNEAYCRYFGLNREDIIGSRFHPTIHPEDRDSVARSMASLSIDHPLVTIDQRIIMPDGSTRWQRWVDRAIFHADGNLKEYQSVGRDITESKLIEGALRQSEEGLRTVIGQSPLSIQIMSPDGRTLQVNHAFEKLWGVTLEDLKNYNMLKDEQLIRLGTMPYIKRGFSGEAVTIPPVHYDTSDILGFGENRWVQGRIYPVRDATGTIRNVILMHEDITDRKQAEEALKESENKYRRITDNAQDLVYRMSLPDGQYEYISPAALQLTGYLPEDYYSDPGLLRNLIHPDWQEYFKNEWEALLKGDMPPFYEYQIIDREGKTRWLYQRNVLVKNECGQPVAIEGIVTDITGRKQVEEELRQSEEQYRELADSITDVFFAMDNELRYTYWNKASETLTGIESRDAIGRSINDIFPDTPEIRKVTEIYRQVLKARQPKTFESQYIIGEQTLFFEIRVYPSFGGISVFTRNITGHKQAEKALLESEMKHRILIEELSDPLFTFTPEGQYTFANQALAEGFDTTVENIIGKKIWDFFPKEEADKRFASLNQVFRTGEKTVLEGVVPRSDGDRYYVTSISPIKDKTGKVISAICSSKNITDRKQAEETVKSALAEREVLLREIHHRVKNNLAGIISLINLQISSLTDPVQISRFKDLETRIWGMALVHESLYSTKDIALINVASYTENLTRHLFQIYDTGSPIRCRIEMGDVTMPIETAIPCGLVMGEIVTNSLKYAFPKTFSCRETHGEPCTITLTLHREGSDYLLGVADNGIGMQKGIDVSRPHSLGLYLIRHIVEHQLRGSLETRITNGTAYTIRFPEPVVQERNIDE
jgi:PAS domain S-box-containing protein